MNLFGNKKKKAKETKSSSSGGGGLSFSRVQVVSKPEVVGKLLKGIKEQTIEADVARQKLKAASLVSGRGSGTVYNYVMHPFKTGPRPVAIVGFPRSTSGGNFVPADNPLETGEAVEFTFSMPLAEADGNTLYFNARGPYIQTAIYIPNAKEPSKPWVGSRELTEKKMGAGALKQGEEVLQIRVDQLTVYPNAPETFTGDQFSPYVFSPSLFVICGGGVWAKRGGNGYFEEIPQDLAKYMEKQEQIKEIKPVTLAEFGVDTIAMVASEDLFTDFEHDRLVPSVKKKPNDNLQVLNSILGFLLRFEVSDDIKELMMRTFSQKVGKEVEVWLPLTLGQITDMEPPKQRLLFQIFPRDLTQETNPSRRKSHPGVKFVPPFTLHPNPEDQNTYRKLMVCIGQRMKDDARPEDERNKLASVQAQVAQRQQETKGKRVDENLKKSFQKRQEAKKRQESAG
jgi:hypothetical protein